MTIKGFRELSFLLLTMILGCGFPERPQEITISKAPVFRPSNPKEINNIEQALAAIITICRDDIGLPVVDPLHVKLYKNSASFAFYGHGWRTLPYDVANQVAFARDNEINIDLEKVGRNRATSIWLLAHEYAHNVHHGVAEKRRTASFYTEGFADWVAARVMHFLKWQDYAVTLHHAKRELLRHRDVLPESLSILDDRFWKRTLDQPKGRIRTYNLAFMAMDNFVQQKGLAKTIESLHYGNFGAMSLSAFDSELKNSLTQTTSPSKDKFTVDRPDWKVGDKWTYSKISPGLSTTVVKEVIGEDTYRGTPVFILKSGEEDTLYGKEGLGFLAAKRNGQLISRVNKVYRFFSWPLEPGKEWPVSFTQKNLEDNSSADTDRTMTVAGIEEIRVPAGDFDAVKIEGYGAVSGSLRAEYWYSPKVKWFVKIRTYDRVGVTEEELTSVE